MPSGSGRWSIRVGTGSRLTLREAAIDAPGVSLAVSLAGADSRLEVLDSRLNVASLAAQGPAGSRVDIRGGRLWVADAGGPRVVGATLEWDGRASPPLKAAEAN
jgi:hypothetical protein